MISILKNTALFSSIKEEDIPKMLSCLSYREKQYPKDTYILTAEQRTEEFGILLKGSANIIKEDYWGNRAILTKIQPGEIFAESFVCAETPKIPVSVVTSEETVILFLKYKNILTPCDSPCSFHKTLIENLIKIIALKNIALTNKIDHLVKPTIREKLLSFLSLQAQERQSNRFTILFDRQELADYLSVNRSALSKELSKMKEEGLLDYHKNSFVLKS